MAEKCFTRMGQIGIAVKDIKAAGEISRYGKGDYSSGSRGDARRIEKMSE